ncbi:MAG TPA: glycosyltransferase family 39 protein [Bacteroidia bacterium]|jgi:hypothetical protein
MEKRLKENRTQTNLLLIVAAALLFLYAAVKAALLAITWDEAYTYIEFARNGKIFLDKYEMMSANNHILNTAGMILFTKLFGVHEFVMRIPALIAYVLFLFYSARLVRQIAPQWLALSAFIVLNVNPYMIDFFSVARGYGLSLGLMMASIYYFYLFHKGPGKKKPALISVAFGSLAVFANFVLLNYFVVLTGLLCFLSFYSASQTVESFRERILVVVKEVGWAMILAILVVLFVLPIASSLKEAGALFFGGERSFWSDTISTITDRCFYEQGYNYWIQRLAKGFMFFVLLISCAYFLVRLVKRSVTVNTLFLGSLVCLLIFCSLSTVVQHHLMQTPYLLDRTALFLVVLFHLVVVFSAMELSKEKRLAVFVMCGYSVLLVIHFCLCFNLSYILEWKNDCNTKEMLVDLERTREIPAGKETVSIGIPLIFDPAINFYREKNNLTWLNTAWRDQTNSRNHDYYFLSQNDLPDFNMDSLEVIRTYPVTGNVLAKPRFRPKEIEAAVSKKISFEKEEGGSFLVGSDIEYPQGFSYVINDSITPVKQGIFAFYAEVKAPDISRNNLIMVISFQDEKGNLYSWQKAYVKDFIQNEGEWFRASFTCIIPQEAKQGHEVKSYLWNPDKHELYIRSQEFKWLSYLY